MAAFVQMLKIENSQRNNNELLASQDNIQVKPGIGVLSHSAYVLEQVLFVLPRKDLLILITLVISCSWFTLGKPSRKNSAVFEPIPPPIRLNIMW